MAIAVFVPTPTNAQETPVSVMLPDGFAAMAVQPVTGRVFVATGDKILVIDPDGSMVTAITDLPGVSALVINGDSLYALVSGASRIDRISTTLLAQTGSWAFDEYPLRDTATFVAGRLFFSVEEQGDYLNYPYSSIYALDPLSGDIDYVVNGMYHPLLRSSPGHPTRLFVAERRISYGSVQSWEVGGTAPTRMGRTAHGTYEGNVYDFAITVSGTEMTAAIDVPGHFPRVNPGTLVRVDSPYGGVRNPRAVAYSTSGLVHAGSVFSAFDEPDVFVHNVGSSAIVKRIHLEDTPAERGLALSPDGGTLYVVEEEWDPDPRVILPAKLTTIPLKTGQQADGDTETDEETGTNPDPHSDGTSSTPSNGDGLSTSHNATRVDSAPSTPDRTSSGVEAIPPPARGDHSSKASSHTSNASSGHEPASASDDSVEVNTKAEGAEKETDGRGGEFEDDVDHQTQLADGTMTLNQEHDQTGSWPRRVAATSIVLTATAAFVVRRRPL